jgi:hypothetical protein
VLSLISFLLLLFIFRYWEILILGGIILASWKIWERRKAPIDTKIIARLFRQRDDKLQGYVLPIRENVSPENSDIIAKIESQALRNIGVFGMAGSGKSTKLSWFAWAYSNAEEMARYEIEPINVFAFNYHKFEKEKGDFEGLDFEYVDISTRLPNLFNPQYHEDLIQSFSVVFVSEIKSTGLMASMLQDSFRDILEYKRCESWEDFRKNAESVAKNSNGLTQEVATIVAKKVRTLDVGVVGEIDFQFDKSMILGFENLPTELSKNLYSEFYARLIYRKAEAESISGKPHSVLLMVDECHRTLRYGDISIIADILRNGRKHMRTVIATQNASDVLDSLFHFQWFQFRTSNAKDIEHIKKVDELHGEAVKRLNEKEFVWVNDGQSQSIPIFKLDVTRLQEFRASHPQEYGKVTEEKTDEQPQTNRDANVTEEKTIKYDKEETERKTLDVVEASPTGLFVSQVLEKIGFGDRNDSNRGTAFRLIKKMARENGTIRIKDYVSVDNRKHKLVFSKSNPQRAETQIHKRLKDDAKKLFDENKILYTEGLQNQGYDFFLQSEDVFVEAESGLKHSLKEWNDKVMISEKLVITILCNEEDRQRYSYLSCVEAGKTKLILLSELLETLRNLKK